jgi:hypothetical protein
LLNQCPIGQDQEARWLAVAAVGRAHGLDDQAVVSGSGSAGDNPALCKHRLADGHVESRTVHARMV